MSTVQAWGSCWEGVWVRVDWGVGGAMGSKRLVEVFSVGRAVGGLGLVFLVFALIHGLSDFWALRSFSRAVPYFASLDGHLLASAG